MSDFNELDELCVKTIRVFSGELPTVANSGHPGAPMGMAAIAHVLWTRHMKYDPEDPFWINRDRFVLSNGHACALLYTMLHFTGYKQFSLEQLKQFRQVGSITPGHPENHINEYGRVGGVEVTTGPLGQGIANAVGLALAESHLAAVHNTKEFELFNNYTYVTVGDGCLQEGVSCEAASLAGHLGLSKLIVLYDDNKITIDGSTDVSFTEDVQARFRSYGWQVLEVANGDTDLKAIDAAIRLAKSDTQRPSLIAVKTIIGIDSVVAGTSKAHGSPMAKEEITRLRKLYGLSEETHSRPDEVADEYRRRATERAKHAAAWRAMRKEYGEKQPEQAKQLDARLSGSLPDGWDADLPSYAPTDSATATRKLGGKVLEKLVKRIPALIGGSADLTGSTLTRFDGDVDYQKDSRQGRYLRFGVREHAMAALANGLVAYHPEGALIPHIATFLNFLQYALPSFRLAALSHFGVAYVMTHDSIGLGEDGPTHQPINAGALVRSTPNSLFVRPADGNECAGAWRVAIKERTRPTVLALSRQNTPHLEGTSADNVFKGAYALNKVEKPKVILIGTGTELQLCVEAAKQLEGARVVSMPCQELFEEQGKEYRESVLPEGVPVVSVEALSTFGWSRYAHVSVGMTSFGKSGPAPDVYQHFGITVDGVVAKANLLLAAFKDKPAPALRFE